MKQCPNCGWRLHRRLDASFARNRALIAVWARGGTLEEAGSLFGLTRERARQLINRFASADDRALRESVLRERRLRAALLSVERRLARRERNAHGTLNRYRTCRCDLCRKANRVRMRAYYGRAGYEACPFCDESGFTRHGLKCHVTRFHQDVSEAVSA